MQTLLYNRKSYVSARALATNLGLKPISDRKVDDLSSSPLVRYGSSKGSFSEDTDINSRSAISLVSNSMKFSEFCFSNGFFSPIYRRFHIEDDIEFPFLLRDNYHHGGKDIVFVENKEQLESIPFEDTYGKYYVPFYDTQYEIRIHWMFGDIIKLFVKRPIDSEKASFIRSSYKGWRYSLREDIENKYTKAKEITHSLCAALDIRFCAIDMAYSKERDQYIIWEVNSAPGLNLNTLKLYAERLREYL